MGLLVLAFGEGRELLESLSSVGLIPDLIVFDDAAEDMPLVHFLAALTEALGHVAPPVVCVVSKRTAEVTTSPSFRPGQDTVFERPVRAREMIWGILSALGACAGEGGVLHAGGLELDVVSRTLTYGSRNVHLTRFEFGFMEYLMRRGGRLVTNDELLEQVWGFQPGTGAPEVIRAHVRNLRRKLEFLGARPNLIWTLPGRGYQLREAPEPPSSRLALESEVEPDRLKT
jgi:DNA-binding response OmpR family regulator